MSNTNKNKVRFGLKNVHYAPLHFNQNGEVSYDTPIPIPGAVNMSLSKSGEDYEFYADDGVYFDVGDNSRMDGDLEIALIPESFRTGPLGEELDKNGVLIENSEMERGHFALLFEFTADARAVRHVIYNCTASQNATEGETKGENIQVKTEQLAIHARPLNGRMKTKTGNTTTAEVYDGWYNAVYMPEADGETEGSDGKTEG